MCFIKEQILTFNQAFSMTICIICIILHHSDILLFHIFIYLFIDEEEGNGLALGCTAFTKICFCGVFSLIRQKNKIK